MTFHVSKHWAGADPKVRLWLQPKKRNPSSKHSTNAACTSGILYIPPCHCTRKFKFPLKGCGMKGCGIFFESWRCVNISGEDSWEEGPGAFMDNTCTIHVQYMCNTCTIHVHEHYLESCAKVQHARMQFPIHAASNMVSKTYVPLSVCHQRS